MFWIGLLVGFIVGALVTMIIFGWALNTFMAEIGVNFGLLLHNVRLMKKEKRK